MMIIDGSAGATFPDGSQQAVAKPAAPQSMVWLTTANGYGSTNTMIKRYTTTVTSQGSDITYADSATLGASFTINTSGVYAIGIWGNASTANNIGISVNSSQLSTIIYSITAANRLGYSAVAAAAQGYSGVTVYLAAGSVVRPHTDGIASSNTAVEQFQITRVA